MDQQPRTFSLLGKVVFITECQPGDDLGLPLAFAQAGADLAITAPDAKVLAPTVQAVQALGRQCHAYRLDFTDLASITQAVEDAVRDFGRLDALINNVGYNVPSWAVDVTPDEWARIVQINMTGPFFCAQSAGRHMLAAGRGRIVNVGTHTAVRSNVRRAAYGAARAGMVQYTRNLALEWAPKGVTVNSVAPAYIKPENLQKYPEMYAGMRQKNPMGRFATEAEVGAACIFLASDAASFITGQVLSVDGGSGL